MQTIAALATPRGRSALAIIRVSGEDSHAIVEKCLVGRGKLVEAGPGRIALYRFVDGKGETIDEVTAIRYDTPRSYTGENMVEIICHGNPLVGESILRRLYEQGAEAAGGGEFSRRAVENGKIDILRAEAIREVIESRSENGLKSAVSGYQGELRKKLEKWREKIIGHLGIIEAGLEFPEEDDQEEISWAGKVKVIEDLVRDIEEELEKRKQVCRIEEGIEVGIVGVKNAGKSSLFNWIVGENRSIVHGSAGTTRDLVSERVRIGGMDVRIVDTAGLGETDDPVEFIGIERSNEEVLRAGLLIWVSSADEGLTGEEKEILEKRDSKDIIGIVSKTDRGDASGKIDLMKKWGIECEACCLVRENDGRRAASFIARTIKERNEARGIKSVFINERHEHAGRRMVELLRGAIKVGDGEIIAEYLRGSLGCVDEFFGVVDSSDVMNRVFEKFCIGK